MHCSDALLIASGTATLEAMFLKKPMVISYRMAAASWMLLSRMVKTPFVGLPNILAREAVAPEILQQDATAPRLADEVMRVLDQGGVAQVARFNDLAGQIGGDFARRSVEALSPLAER
jgi:lipid-A-disaccharide synthase